MCVVLHPRSTTESDCLLRFWIVNGVQNEPMAAIAPKKPNWDLRRDVAKKMEKLERRTQRAMIELMREATCLALSSFSHTVLVIQLCWPPNQDREQSSA